MRFVISYDLNRPGQNYTTLWEALAQLGAQRILQSQWIVRRNTSAQELNNFLWQYMDQNDRLLVTCLDDGNWWQRNLRADPNRI